MNAGFHAPPVIAGGNHHGIDSVHDALVAGGRTIGICCSKGICRHDTVHYIFTADGLLGEGGGGTGQPVICQIGEDPQLDGAAGELLDGGGDRLRPWC